jgi:hypothetical protein
MLIPFDDYPVHQTALPLAHAGGGQQDFYDRFWFNGYTEDMYFAVAMGFYPNRGVLDAAFSVVRDGVQRSVFASGRMPADRTRTRIGPIDIEIVDPLRVNRVRVDAPEHGLVADLTFSSRTPVCEEPRQTRWSGTRLWMDATRAASLGTWSGSLKVAGNRIRVPKGMYGTKDRSWGLRPVADPAAAAPDQQLPQIFFLWAPLNFEDECLHFLVFEDSDGVAWARTGARLPLLGKGEPIVGDGGSPGIEHVSVRHSVRWAEGLRRSEGATLSVTTRDGVQAVELEPINTFRMRGVGYGHPDYPHGRWHDELMVAGEALPVEELDGLDLDQVHVQQVVRAKWEGRTGLGVLEQLAVGPHAPSGFTELLDGAAPGALSGPPLG